MKRDESIPSASSSVINNSPSNFEEKLDDLTKSFAFKMTLNELRLTQKYKNNDQKLKVSVIMPTWNRAFVITRAIDSVLNQTYANYELIVSDDGSDDDTKEIIHEYMSRDSRLKYLTGEHDGVSRARNVALRNSTGELIAYLDSDNEWSENYLMLMVNSFSENQHCNTIYSGIKIVDNINMLSYTRLKKFDRDLLLKRNYIDINIFMHKRSLIDRLKGFDEDLTSLEDWDLIIRYTKDKAPFVLEACLATYYYEEHFGQLSFEEGLDENFKKIRDMYS